jgi:guanine nucleotide-binding protein subunit alpha
MANTTVAEDKRAASLMQALKTTIDRLRQSISSLRELHDRWQDPKGTFINLIAQLTSLKSNLGEIDDWMHYSITDMHEQLLLDTDLVLTSCVMLVRNLDNLFARLDQPDHSETDWAIRLKFAIASRSMNRLRGVAKRQTDAVLLLLAACKW